MSETLMGLIVALLLAAQQPGIPAELRDTALRVANHALSLVEAAPVVPERPVEQVVQAPTPAYIGISMSSTTSALHGGKTPFLVTLSAYREDGSVDTSARLITTLNAPWWFHGENGDACSEGCPIRLGVPFNAAIPSDPGTYTFTVRWLGTDVSTSTLVVVR